MVKRLLPFVTGVGTSGASSNLSVCTRASGEILVPAKTLEGKDANAGACKGLEWKYIYNSNASIHHICARMEPNVWF